MAVFTTAPVALVSEYEALEWSMSNFALVSRSSWLDILQELPLADMDANDHAKMNRLSKDLSLESIVEFCPLKNNRSCAANDRYFDVNELVEKFPACAAFLLLLAECHIFLEDYPSARHYLLQIRSMIPQDDV